MAKIYPDATTTRMIFRSAAEEKFYERCRELSDGWRVWHSVTLSAFEGDGGLKDNEIDFILYHPKYGLVVVEVKGGRISRNVAAGTFSSINRHGETFEIKDPFHQALVFKSRLIRQLKAHELKVPVSYAVSFPSADEADFPEAPGMATELILGRNRMKALEQALKALVEKSQPAQYLDFSDIAKDLDRLFIGSSFTTRLYLRDYLDRHESRLRDVETIQESLITPIASARRLGIEGEAGTGKTMLAVLLAKHFRDQGQSVLLLGSNALLNLLLVRDLGEGVDVKTYPELAASYGINLLIPPPDYEGAKDDWIQYDAPERLKRAIAQTERRWQIVICDEAQDVQPFWWEAIESLLLVNEIDGRFYLFFDAAQGVFGSGEGQARFVAAETLPIKPPYFPLVHNYRTTREIAAFARAFRTNTETLQSHCGRLGYLPEVIVYKDADDAKRLLDRLVRKLTKEEGLSSSEITLLSARNPAARESVLYQTAEVGGLSLHRLTSSQRSTWAEATPDQASIGVTTIAGFKGLEAPVGILLNISEYNLPIDHPIMASLVYVACSRAKHMLYVFLKEGDPKIEAFKVALAQLNVAGTLVIDKADADFVFAGRVVHWNPERVGWLAVEDPAFEQGSVMFFPHDVAKSQLAEIKVGMRLKFRPRAEGQVTIASDLTLPQGA